VRKIGNINTVYEKKMEILMLRQVVFIVTSLLVKSMLLGL